MPFGLSSVAKASWVKLLRILGTAKATEAAKAQV